MRVGAARDPAERTAVAKFGTCSTLSWLDPDKYCTICKTQVQSAFDAYDPQLLTNIDSAKKIVLSRIIEFKGDNDFNYHRRSGE